MDKLRPQLCSLLHMCLPSGHVNGSTHINNMSTDIHNAKQCITQNPTVSRTRQDKLFFIWRWWWDTIKSNLLGKCPQGACWDTLLEHPVSSSPLFPILEYKWTVKPELIAISSLSGNMLTNASHPSIFANSSSYFHKMQGAFFLFLFCLSAVAHMYHGAAIHCNKFINLNFID